MDGSPESLPELGEAEERGEAPVGREGERREEEFSSSALAANCAAPLVWCVSSRPGKRAAPWGREERPRTMGSPALWLALLLPPVLLLLLRVPPSRGFPGKAGGGTASPPGHRGPPPFATEGGAGAPFVCVELVFRRPGEVGDAERGSRLGTRRGEPTFNS